MRSRKSASARTYTADHKIETGRAGVVCCSSGFLQFRGKPKIVSIDGMLMFSMQASTIVENRPTEVSSVSVRDRSPDAGIDHRSGKRSCQA